MMNNNNDDNNDNNILRALIHTKDLDLGSFCDSQWTEALMAGASARRWHAEFSMKTRNDEAVKRNGDSQCHSDAKIPSSVRLRQRSRHTLLVYNCPSRVFLSRCVKMCDR